jgi:hypothetical protein
VAVVGIVSPGNKGGAAERRTFVQRAAGRLHQGVHLLVVDPFPPTRRDPDGIHPAIWAEVDDAPFDRPADFKPLLGPPA